MRRRESRLDAATKIKDAALVKIKAEGEFHEAERFGPVWWWRSSELSMALRSPFQMVPSALLPWGLDIWATGKVMNILWHNDGRVELTSFRRGNWEKEVLGWMYE